MNIKEMRKCKGMKQSELARRMGVRQNTVSQWESGINHPRVDMLPDLADVLGCTLDELLRSKKENPA